MKKIRVMIISLPGTWQQVLQKNMEAYSFVEAVDSASGSLSAAQLISQHQPHLVLIDSSIPCDDSIVLIQKLKIEYPKIVSVAIADTREQRRRIARSGADHTLSSANYGMQIRDILHQLKDTLLDGKTGSNTSTGTGTRSSE